MTTVTHEVFISYSWDSGEHIARVIDLVQAFRRAAVEAWIDKFNRPVISWPDWCCAQVSNASFVLVVCTATYSRRVMRQEGEPNVGRGTTWEGFVITNTLYDGTTGQNKFIPVVFGASSLRSVLYFLEDYSAYNASDDESFNELYGVIN